MLKRKKPAKPTPSPDPPPRGRAANQVAAAMMEVGDNLRSVVYPKWTGGRPFNPRTNDWDNEDALALVEDMAAHGKTMRTIGAHFGIQHRVLETHIGKDRGDNAVNMAWQKGRAAHEQYFADLFIAVSTGDSKGAVIAAIFYAKAQFGWRDRSEAALNVNTGPTWILPGPMTEAELYKKLGIEGPVEAVLLNKPKELLTIAGA